MVSSHIVSSSSEEKCILSFVILFTAFNVFEWQENDSLWTPYSVAFSIQLEKAVQAGAKTETLSLKSPALKYNIDLKKMTQTNAKTKFSRAIRRGQLGMFSPELIRLQLG